MTDLISLNELKLTPDWAKEPKGRNPYADHPGTRDAGGRGSSFRERRDRRGGGRPPGRRESHGKKPSGFDRRRDDHRRPNQAQTEPPVALEIDFLPDKNCVASIARQLKAAHAAYPLFTLGRMFLQQPERHVVRIRSTDENRPLYRFADGGEIALNQDGLMGPAFDHHLEEFYEREVIEKDAPSGHFQSVAFCPKTGTLLGPTNHHAYPFKLRSHYERHFQNRLSFERFRSLIEIKSDPESIEKWKEQIRFEEHFKPRETDGAPVLESREAARKHFAGEIFPGLVKENREFLCPASRIGAIVDRRINRAIKEAWDKEMRFPAKISSALRIRLLKAGLHTFKHRKRILHVCSVRPRCLEGEHPPVAPSIAAILDAVKARPRCTRKDLATTILGEAPPEETKAKSELAANLHWLLLEGLVVEFFDGTLDLPLPHRSGEKKGAPPSARHGPRTAEA